MSESSLFMATTTVLYVSSELVKDYGNNILILLFISLYILKLEVIIFMGQAELFIFKFKL